MSLKIETAFPGGNVFIEDINGFEVTLARDMRNTEGDWFYWMFRALFDQKGEYRFTFTQNNSCGTRGPAVSYDDGNTWEWLGSECVSGSRNVFTYCYDGKRNSNVVFCVGMQYLPQHLEAFLTRHADSPYLSCSTLTRTRKNREVKLLHIEDSSSRGSKKHIYLSSRNHCCEMMATYALEGILETALGSDSTGKLFREKYIIDCVPFVDTDGVTDGDQGKNRRPHDHNRDYGEHPIYPEIAAIQKLVMECKPFFTLDLHCPWLFGTATNETIYFPVVEDPYYAEQTGIFSKILEKRSTAEVPFFAKNNVPFGTLWNTAENYKQGFNCQRWMGEFCKPRFAAAIEIPYANLEDITLSADSVRSFGRVIAEAIREYDALFRNL